VLQKKKFSGGDWKRYCMELVRGKWRATASRRENGKQMGPAQMREGPCEDFNASPNYFVRVMEAVDVLPAVSHAFAVTVCVPVFTFFVFQVHV
jgi:hypothetical protein